MSDMGQENSNSQKDPLVQLAGLEANEVSGKYSTPKLLIIFLTTWCVSLIIGLLWLAGSTEGGTFDEKHDLYPLQEIQVLLSTALQNSALYAEVQLQARLDGATRLLNHTAFFEELGRELKRAQRFKHPLSLIILDLDNFKEINDKFGHSTGDRVLVELANLLRDMLRGVDRPARFGGDEFAIILPQTNIKGAKILAERIMVRIKEQTVHFAEQEISVAASMGLAQMEPNMNKEQLFENADTSLLDAKRQGKNRIVVSGENEEEEEEDSES